MECRIDVAQPTPRLGLQSALISNVAEVPTASVMASRAESNVPTDMRREFAEKLTRISNLLGVLTHLVRVEDLPVAERQRFDASLQLAELEISQAGEMIRCNRKSSCKSEQNGLIRVDEIFREAVDSFRLRMLSEGVESETVLSPVSVACDELALRSMLLGLMKLAMEVCHRRHGGSHLTARMLVEESLVHIALDVSGPACASAMSAESDASITEASKDSLARCEQLASILGGNLRVRRVVEEGSLSVAFKLPRLR